MGSHVDHNFELGHEGFKANHVAMGADHFDGHRCHRFSRINANCFALQDATESTSTQLSSCLFELQIFPVRPN